MGLINISEHFVRLLGPGVMMMGIMNWVGDGDDGDDEDPLNADGGDLFGDMDGGDMDDGGFGDMDDGMDDGMGDGMDDWADDGGFGDMDDGESGGAAVQDLEHRVNNMESELAQLSSTVNTVRSENEEIATSVGDIEENVRKLLEIYEMVTRGVNPFVEDTQGGALGGGGGGFGESDFGLFDDDEEEAADDGDDIDDDIADADAESFFDDDAFDEVEDEDELTDELNEGDDAGEFGEEVDAESSGGGTSFQELKEEFDSGEAEWADDIEAEESEDPTGEIEVELDDGLSEEAEENEADDAAVEEFEFDDAVEPEPSRGEDGKPYLEALPSGYVVDLVVMEWLDYLVTEFGEQSAIWTVDYYEQIDWISEPVKEQLMDYLQGFSDTERDPADVAGPIEMDIDDHIRSLTFISQITGDSAERRVVEDRAQLRGESHGLQC